MDSIGLPAAKRLVAALSATLESCSEEIDLGYTMLAETLRSGNTVYACGNGGSSATAAHFIAELVGRYKVERGPLRAVALGSNLSSVTAIGNDYGYDQIFVRELQGLAKPGDLLVAFTTSGASPNVMRAIDACNELDVRTVVLTGSKGAHLGEQTSCTVAIPVTETARIQELHDLTIHIWCEALDANLTRGE